MKFNEEEVGSLIQRASELHERSLDDSQHNLTLSEIESIADELGIPSRFLIEAALEKKEGNPESSFSVWGAPFQVDQTALVEGAVSDEQWNEALSELQEFSGKSGKSEMVGATRRWSHIVGEGESGINFEELTVSMRPVKGKTSIRIHKGYKGAVAMYIAAFGLTSFLTLMVAHSLPDISKISELIYAGMVGSLSLGGVRAMISVSARRFRQQLTELSTRLEQAVAPKKATSSSINDEQGSIRADAELPHQSILDERDVADQTPETVVQERKREKNS